MNVNGIRRLISTVFISLAFTGLLFSSASASTISGPGWQMETAQPVSPAQAQAYYNSLPTKSTSTTTILLAPQGATPLSATAATPEITELARALRYDPKLIYDYVHNNIDYVPYFGSTKGATLTYLDGSGNDFDQASLMIALLRASGLCPRRSAREQFHRRRQPAKQFFPREPVPLSKKIHRTFRKIRARSLPPRSIAAR